MSDIGHWSNPKARKAHTCELCGRRIAPGEAYRRYDGIYAGRANNWKECGHCTAAIWLFDIENWLGEGVGPDDMSDWEPRNVTELRNKVYYNRRWTRPDGELYPIPTGVAK